MNVEEIDLLITEKATKAEYRKRKFEKRHKYNPEDGTIEVDGERVNYKYIGGTNKRSTAPKAQYNYPSKTIRISRSIFNQKHSTSPDFAVHHELGHKKVREYENELDWDADEPFDIERKIKPHAQKFKPNSHASKMDEYKADYYAKTHVKGGMKTSKNALHDLHAMAKHSEKLRKTTPQNRKGARDEITERVKSLKELSKGKEGDYIKKL